MRSRLATLVSTRPDLPETIVEVEDPAPPYDWKVTAKKAAVPALVAAVTTAAVIFFPTPEHLEQAFHLSPAASVLIWQAVANYGKHHGWWDRS